MRPRGLSAGCVAGTGPGTEAVLPLRHLQLPEETMKNQLWACENSSGDNVLLKGQTKVPLTWGDGGCWEVLTIRDDLPE